MQEDLFAATASATAPVESLFFAIFPDATAQAAMLKAAGAARDRFAPGASLQRSERLHTTLHHLGEYAGLPDTLVEAARAAGDLRFAPFDVAFDRIGSFRARPGAKAPCVLHAREGEPPLHALHAALAERLSKAGLGCHLKPEFSPHVTVFYDRRVVPLTAVEPIVWRVGEWVLVSSLVGQGRYRELGRWEARA